MKINSQNIILSLALAWATVARAQPDLPAPPAPPDLNEVLQKAQAESDRAQGEAARQAERAQRQVEAVQREIGQYPYTAPGAKFTDRLQTIIHSGPGGPGNALVIRSSEGDPKELADMQEDLAVMSRILDKSVEEKLGAETHGGKAMGISVLFGPNSSPVRSFYLDGYGALLMLRVHFPLLPPPAKTESQKQKQPEDSQWEAARRELYGQPADRADVAPPGEEYSEEKVNNLKDALLEALKNAANIRDLKPDESATVCVFGGGSRGARGVKTTTFGRPNKGTPAPQVAWQPGNNPLGGAPMRGTIMTIRIKKSDAEAFSKGKLNLEEFRKKARIATYAGDVGGEDGVWVGSSGGGFSGGGFGMGYSVGP